MIPSVPSASAVPTYRTVGTVGTVFTRPTLSGYLTKISETRIVKLRKNFGRFISGKEAVATTGANPRDPGPGYVAIS